MKRVALYLRVSTPDQHPETELYDVRQLAQQRGFHIDHEYTDKISGTRARRPGLDQLLADARRGKFDVVRYASQRMTQDVYDEAVSDEKQAANSKEVRLVTRSKVSQRVSRVNGVLLST